MSDLLERLPDVFRGIEQLGVKHGLLVPALGVVSILVCLCLVYHIDDEIQNTFVIIF